MNLSWRLDKAILVVFLCILNNKMIFKYFIKTFIFFISFSSFIVCTPDLIRGCNPSNRKQYGLDSEFKCFDGSKSIPLDQINDDYCDCNDGSDEPGTSACPNGVFYCVNEGYQPVILASNRVADGVCDCCDGSDEYTGYVQCQNTCIELGQQLRADEEKKYSMFVVGNEVFRQYCEEGEAAKQQHKDKIQKLELEKEKLESEKADQDSTVKSLEEPEKEAKDKFRNVWEESRNQRREERQKKRALELFTQLDLDFNNRVSLEELKAKVELDTDEDGHVSHEEAMGHMAGDEESIEFSTFYERVWANMDKIFKNKTQQEKNEQVSEENPAEQPSEEDDEEGRKEEEEEEEDEEEDVNSDQEEEKDETKKDEKEGEDEDDEMPPYDAQTQNFIDVAESARTIAQDMGNKLNNVNNEIEHSSKIIDSDYGPNNEFYPLSSQCMELTDREYLYKLCPFDKVTQRNKNGGSETSLGYWSRWEDSSYRIMFFDKGQGCWNGPDRSTKVSVECGPENKLLSAEEPSRCEYHFVLSSPAACRDAPHHQTTPRPEL